MTVSLGMHETTANCWDSCLLKRMTLCIYFVAPFNSTKQQETFSSRQTSLHIGGLGFGLVGIPLLQFQQDTDRRDGDACQRHIDSLDKKWGSCLEKERDVVVTDETVVASFGLIVSSYVYVFTCSLAFSINLATEYYLRTLKNNFAAGREQM